ncbi:MAG: peptidoglycan recognition protein family protein [Phycisphaerales bacterium]|nr:peptidoglycan recognition protein family protein [Phycisphaerales bacterium]
MASRASTRTKSRSRKASGGVLTRTAVVWISFIAASTLVGGILLTIDGRSVPRLDGMSLSPLAAATTIGSDSDPMTRTRVAVDAKKWQAIVIHHSASIVGSPTSISKEHEAGGREGLGHHFIIGNGTGMEDGQVYIGYRWLDQQAGVHAAGPNAKFYNDHSVSICLVGDGERRPFTPAQLATLQKLVSSLSKQLGLTDDRVLLHSDIAPGVSDPGKLYPAGLYGARPMRQP